MPKQMVMWAALPNGIQDGKARLSIVVSPRLTPDAGATKLSEFPAFRHWTETAGAATFTVHFDGHDPVEATQVGPALRPDLWELLVADDTFVRPHEVAKFNGLSLSSFPAANVTNYLLDQMVKFATTSPTEFPAVTDLLQDNAFGAIHLTDDDEKLIETQIKNTLQQHRAMPPEPPAPKSDVYQLKRYFTPTTTQPVTPAVPEFDFHQLWSMLGQHPALQRLLGIVIDVEFTPPPNLTSPATVWVKPTWNSGLPEADSKDYPSRTRCLIGATGFLAASRPAGPELEGGLLRLTDTLPNGRPRYEVFAVDEAGAALRLHNFANTLTRMTTDRFADGTPPESSIPAIRSGGLSLVRTGKALAAVVKFAEDAAKNDDIAAGQDVLLYAEDVTRGYRLDVYSVKHSRWFSAHQCTTTYRFTKAAPQIVVELDDEGWVSTALTHAADGSNPDQAKMSETLARWQGYSLSATRPGRGVNVDETGAEPSENPAATAFRLGITRAARNGTLLPLRSGREYRFRLRAVDWAGNSVPQNDSDLHQTLHTSYGLFEPVPVPSCLKTLPISEGGGTEHLVLRSNEGVPSAADDARWLVPPKITQSETELMGLLDTPTGLNPAAYSMLAARADGSLDAGGVADPDDHGKPYYPLLSFPVESGTARVPYLVHPWARGVSLRGLPGAAGVGLYSFGDAPWPATRPIRLVLTEGSGPPVFEPSSGTLQLKLPKAERATVRYSAYVAGEDLEKMALWQEIVRRGGLSQAQLAALASQARQGLVWMLTPYRELTLVHAVRQPLPQLALDNVTVSRLLGETYASLRDISFVHRKSTNTVDVVGEWTDPIDPLDEPGPKDVHFKDVALRRPVPVETPLDRLIWSGKHEFKDTKYHRVSYSLTGTTRFAEYFVQRVVVTWNAATETKTIAGGIGLVPGWDHIVRRDPNTGEVIARYQREVHYTVDHEAGSVTRLNHPQSMPLGVPVQIRYLARPITRESVTVEREIPSSARPQAPKVLYALPAFGWSSEGSTPSKIISDRIGNYLRVYLDRPWYSSGAGELLGVVLWPVLPGISPPERIRPFMTQWGIDPIWSSAAMKATYPTPADFPLAVPLPPEVTTGLSLDEVPGSVSVAGHEVGYDAGRRLWYCDIQVDAGASYTPFVRLALARYQPKSLPGAHLSRVVLAEFAQLAPNRFATLTFPTTSTVNVVVTGASYGNSAIGAGPSQMTVTVETRNNSVADPDLRWTPGATIALNSAALRDGAHWSGTVPLPGARGSQPFRLVIREMETFRADGGVIFPVTAPRVVFVNTVEI